jgi:YHS domain-containing protein
MALNALATVAFAVLFGLTHRHGATDPVCGMRVDRTQAIARVKDGRKHWFCSEGCAERFDTDRSGPVRH